MKPAYPMEFAPTLDIDFEALIAPLQDGDGGGESLRYTPLYQEIRDAQREDDATLPMREWERPLIKADWKTVASLCSEALATRSKDFQIAGWLIEAWTRLHYIEGFIAGTRLVTALAERYWDTAWPRIDDGDADARIAPFVWLNDTLARVITLHVPLLTIEDREPAAVNLDDWQRVIAAVADDDDGNALTRELLAKYVTQSGNLATLTSLHQWLREALDAWTGLTLFLNDRLGNDAPSLARVAEVLNRLSLASTSLLGAHALPAAFRDESQDDMARAATEDASWRQHELVAPAGVGGGARSSAVASSPVITSRSDAYRLLEAVAVYLAQQEPHSPTPYLLRRAVSWGRLPLADLMRQIVREEGDLSRYLALLESQ
jgi:type VI secretion system protein ImpA